MSKNNDDAVRDYGVEEYVPEEGRHYGFMDMMFTWIGANCQPSSWFLGGTLAASGFAVAAGVTLLANPLTYIILALMGFMGYKVATTTMGLSRFSFGIRGTKIPTLFNTISLIGWTAVGNYLGAISISYLLNTLFGWPCYGMDGSWWVMLLGTTINGILSAGFVFIGGSKLVKYAENIAVVAMVILSIWITVSVLKTFPLSEIITWKPSEDVRMPMGVGVDTIMVYSISWVLCIAEFTRYTKSKKAATAAPVIGATLGMYWFALVGTVAVIAAALTTGVFDPNNSDPSSVAATLGLGVPAMLVVILSVATTNMISVYSGSLSACNLFKRQFPVKKMNIIVGVLTILVSFIPVFMGSFMDFFYSFMDLLALVFPALIAIMLVDYYLIRKRNYIFKEIGNMDGPYGYSKGFNWYGIGSWLAGVVSYIIIKNVGIISNTVGAAIPAFIVAGVIYYVLARAAVSKGYYRDLLKKAD